MEVSLCESLRFWDSISTWMRMAVFANIHHKKLVGVDLSVALRSPLWHRTTLPDIIQHQPQKGGTEPHCQGGHFPVFSSRMELWWNVSLYSGFWQEPPTAREHSSSKVPMLTPSGATAADVSVEFKMHPSGSSRGQRRKGRRLRQCHWLKSRTVQH